MVKCGIGETDLCLTMYYLNTISLLLYRYNVISWLISLSLSLSLSYLHLKHHKLAKIKKNNLKNLKDNQFISVKNHNIRN